MFPFGSHHNIHKCAIYGTTKESSYGFSADFFVCCRTPVGEEEKVLKNSSFYLFIFEDFLIGYSRSRGCILRSLLMVLKNG